MDRTFSLTLSADTLAILRLLTAAQQGQLLMALAAVAGGDTPPTFKNRPMAAPGNQRNRIDFLRINDFAWTPGSTPGATPRPQRQKTRQHQGKRGWDGHKKTKKTRTYTLFP